MPPFSSIIAREFAAHAKFPITGEASVTFPEDEIIRIDVDPSRVRLPRTGCPTAANRDPFFNTPAQRTPATDSKLLAIVI
jgi:hypothetical protein